jgi:phosphate transport system substrate-binding protein
MAWLGALMALGLVAAACGNDDDTATDEGEDGTEAADAETDGGGGGEGFNVSGSSTVEPITSLVAEEFFNEAGVEVAVDGPGTGDGFELFCNGETSISDASRPIDDEEIAACEENGIEWIELEVGIDGMAVMTNPNNDDVSELNFADLYALIGPEAEGFSNWSDSQDLASELGSDTQLPDAPLDLTGPGEESGTFDSFIEIALEGIAEERGQEPTTRTDYDANADDNVIIDNIISSDTSLGWVGFAFARDRDDIKNIAIAENPGDEAVEPTDETIADGSYPLARSLFIYVNAADAEENPAVADFVDFYLADLNGFVEEAGYVALPDDRVQETASAWEGR